MVYDQVSLISSQGLTPKSTCGNGLSSRAASVKCCFRREKPDPNKRQPTQGDEVPDGILLSRFNDKKKKDLSHYTLAIFENKFSHAHSPEHKKTHPELQTTTAILKMETQDAESCVNHGYITFCFLPCTSELSFILKWMQNKGLAKLSGAEKDHMRTWGYGSAGRVFIQYTDGLVFHPQLCIKVGMLYSL